MSLREIGLLLIGILPVSILADSSVAVIPSVMGILSDKAMTTLEWTRKEYAPIKFEGDIKAGGVWHNNVSLTSEPTAQEAVGMYAITPWIDRYRFALSIHPITSQGIKTSWNVQPANYEITYRAVSLAACTKLAPDLYGALSFNLIEMDAMQELSLPPSYNIRLQGSDYAPTVTLSLLWRPYRWLALAATGSSHTVMHLKGMAQGYSGAHTVSVSDRVDIPFPAEAQADAMIFFSDALRLHLEAKKKWWSSYKAQDIQIDDPTFEASFGKPIPKNWKDTYAYHAALIYKNAPLTFKAGGTLYTGSNDERLSTLTLPSFGGKSWFASMDTDVSSHLGLSVRYARSYPDSGYAQSSSLVGTIRPGIRDILSVSTKWQW